MEDFITADEAAAYLNRSGTAVRVYCREGLLPAVKVGRDWIIKKEDLEAFTPPKRGRPKTRRAEEEVEFLEEEQDIETQTEDNSW